MARKASRWNGKGAAGRTFRRGTDKGPPYAAVFKGSYQGKRIYLFNVVAMDSALCVGRTLDDWIEDWARVLVDCWVLAHTASDALWHVRADALDLSGPMGCTLQTRGIRGALKEFQPGFMAHMERAMDSRNNQTELPLTERGSQ